VPLCIADGMNILASVFEIIPDATVAQVVQRLKKANLELSAGSPSAADIVPILDSSGKFLSVYGKPASLVTDIKAVQQFLQSGADGGLS
jgi:hypothetical protein